MCPIKQRAFINGKSLIKIQLALIFISNTTCLIIRHYITDIKHACFMDIEKLISQLLLANWSGVAKNKSK